MKIYLLLGGLVIHIEMYHTTKYDLAMINDSL